jgi:LmbE family N-acetylglucosaminyl deacetylase
MNRVLAIGAHPDDIELGCGGALIKHVSRGDQVTMLVVTNGEAGPGRTSQRLHEQRSAAELIGVTHLEFGEFPDGRVSNQELDLVHLIESAVSRHNIDMVYVHGPQDSHQDHRSIAVATWGAARHAKNVLCYDSPSSIQFNPTVFVDITDALEKKVAALQCHSSQVQHSAMASCDLVRTQAGYRGHQARTPAAEGFMPHRLHLPF